MNDTAMRAVVLALVLILPLSALLARRIPWRTTLFYSAIWLGIAALLAIIIHIFT